MLPDAFANIDRAAVARRIAAAAEIVQNGEEEVREVCGDEAMADVDRRTELFDKIAVDEFFSCTVGKVGSKSISFAIIY